MNEALKERMAYLRKPVGQKRGNLLKTVPKSPIAKPLMPSSPVLIVEDGAREDKSAHKRYLQLMKKSVRVFVQINRY